MGFAGTGNTAIKGYVSRIIAPVIDICFEKDGAPEISKGRNITAPRKRKYDLYRFDEID